MTSRTNKLTITSLIFAFSLSAQAQSADAPLVVTSARETKTASLLPPLQVALPPMAGTAAQFRIRTEGAAAQQIHFHNFRLEPGAQLTLHSLSNGQPVETYGPYTSLGESIDGDFLSRIVPGEELLVRLEGSRATEWPFEIAGVTGFDEPALQQMRNQGDASLAAQIAPRSRSEIRFSNYKGHVVEHEVQDGRAIVEGDIDLGEASELAPATLAMGKRPERFGVAKDTGRWPGGIMPYEVDPSLPNPLRVYDAIVYWNGFLFRNLILRPRTSSDANYVRFTTGSGCSSSLGMVGGRQTINLASGCSKGNIIHEIGHAAGLYHEQSREDRDRYVLIALWNVESGKEGNFSKAPAANSSDIVLYDFGSIMHYGMYAFSANDNATIIPMPQFWESRNLMGQRDGFSAFDLVSLMLMYPTVR